jgi:methyl-accepting chemotaxis protein
MNKFLNTLTIPQKFIICGIGFMLPLMVLLIFAYAGSNRSIRNTRLEIYGIKVIEPSGRILDLLPQHQYLTGAFFKGDATSQAELKRTADEIDQAFSDLLNQTGKLSSPLRIDRNSLRIAEQPQIEPARLYQQWQKLRSGWMKLSPEQCSFNHAALIAETRDLYTRVLGTSKLILDPRIDSNHLVGTVFVDMPKGRTMVKNLIERGRIVLTDKNFSREELSDLSTSTQILETIYSPIMRVNVAETIRGNKIFSRRNSSFQNTIPRLFARYDMALANFITMARAIEKRTNTSISPADFQKAGENVLSAGAQFNQAASEELMGLLQKRLAGFRRLLFGMCFLGLASLVLAVTVTFFVSRNLTRPLEAIIRVARSIASRNLQSAKDELEVASSFGITLFYGIQEDLPDKARKKSGEIHNLFQAFATMVYCLDSVLSQVRNSGVQVTGSSTQIAASVREIEATVAEQAASTNEVNATSKEISATVNELAETMNRVTVMASQAAQLASAGLSGIDDIKSTMQTLQGASVEISDKLSIINEKTSNITEVITTITKVANQTNLLSLNATIEAEKAGKYGAGFSVVAREVNRLADQTAVAALDIEDMILEMQTAINDGVTAVKRYTEQTRLSTEKTSRISEDISKIIEYSQHLGPEFEVVNQRMQIQSQSASQISVAMEQLNKSAQLTRDSLVDFKKVTEQLNEAVQGLQKVSRLTMTNC